MTSTTSENFQQRSRDLLTLIDGLQIENDLRVARRNLDDWHQQMLTLVNQIHLVNTHRFDSLEARLKSLKERRSTSLRQEILPNLNKMFAERRKSFTDRDLNEMKKKIGKIENDLQNFGKLLSKSTEDEKTLNEQLVILQKIQRENSQLNFLDRLNEPKRRFTLDTDYSPFIAVSEDRHVLIEDDNHLVLYDDQRRIHEIPWQQGKDQTFVGSIKDLTYSNYLEQFCVLSSVNFFTMDSQTSTLEKSEQLRPSIGTMTLFRNEKNKQTEVFHLGSHFQSVACLPYSSDVYFALNTSGERTSIERWSLISGSLIRRWYHDVFESDDRFICSIRANETCLAISIKQKQRNSNDQGQWRVDLFDFSLVRMFRGVNLKTGGLGTYLNPFDDRSWLVINGNDIWLIGEQAELIEENRFDGKEKIHNIFLQDQRQLIVKMGQPAELRIV